jgi:hypothetical protein
MMKDAYKKLQATYKLPGYTELDNAFEISQIEGEGFLLRNIIKKILERVELYSKILEDLYHAESNIAAMYECNVFDSDEKKNIFRIYKRLLYYHRYAVELDLNYDEKTTAAYINEFWNEWQKLKVDLARIMAQLKTSWTTEGTEKKESGYFG